ncbi:hypothetical protein KIF59_20970 [Enterobacter cloacae subsp. cloacae]|nr:hypothetical protein [Enterobacter cloacae subsp. cloacae]
MLITRHWPNTSAALAPPFFCQMTYWMDKLTSDLQGVHKTSEKFQDETGLSEKSS